MSKEEMLLGREPFLWEGASREAVLCIHGFTGSPGVFRKLGRILSAEGFSVCAPLLPGHGTRPEELLAVTEADWAAAAEDAFFGLSVLFDRVHLVGLSLGGALAVLLAAKHAENPVLGGVALLSPGLGLNRVLAARLGLDRIDYSAVGDRIIPLPCRNPDGGELDECLFGYDAVPVRSVGALQRLSSQARNTLAEVTAPVLLLYSSVDAVADADSIAAATGILPSLEEARCFPMSEHNLLLGTDREETISRCTAFLSRHRLGVQPLK